MRVAVHTRHPEHPEQHVYELVAAHELPRVDLSRSLRSVFCDSSNISRLRDPGSNGVRHVSFLRKMAGVLTAGYSTGVLLSIIMPWVPAEYGRPVALIATVLALPSFVVGFRPMRYDIVVFLIRTYDFWYFVSVNTVSCVLLALYFGDMRAIVMLMPWMGNLNSALVDANARMTRHLIVASIIGMVVNSVLIACVQFRLIQAARRFTLLEYGGRALSVEDVIVNGLATHMLLLLRNVYRRTRDLANELQQSASSTSSLVHCVNYQCTTKLQLIQERVSSSRTLNGSSRVRLLKSRPRGVNSEKNSSRTAQLTFVKEKPTFNAKNTHVPVQVSNTPWSFWKRLVLRWIIFTGILLPIVGASDVCTPDQRRWAFYVASACTYVFCALAWGSSQRQLYQKIVFTFDYFFLSFQLTSLHACACDMVSWDASCLGLANSWLWMHFVISSDALAPVMRAKIGFSTKLLALPVVLFVFIQAITWYRLVVEGNTNFRDRELFDVFVGRHRIEFRVVPFFFGRLVTTFLWSFRLLWRILRTQGDETLLLRGKVAYACASQHRAAIVPTADTTRERHLR